jgi:hypothetical protein
MSSADSGSPAPATVAPADPAALLSVGVASPDPRSKRIDTLLIVLGFLLVLGALGFVPFRAWAKLGNYLAFLGSLFMGAPSARTLYALKRGPRAEVDVMALSMKGKEVVRQSFQAARTVHFVNFSTLDLWAYALGIVLLCIGLFVQLVAPA